MSGNAVKNCSDSKVETWPVVFDAVGLIHRGGRKHLEDFMSLKVERGNTFLAVFDGHSGKEAALYARDNLWKAIKSSDGFDSSDPVMVIQAIKAGFVTIQRVMSKARESWKKTKDGDLSNSGTTVACVIIQQSRMFIANVGDSAVVLGKANPKYGKLGKPEVIAKVMTRKHSLKDEMERKRIEQLGGLISSDKGVERVVWKRVQYSQEPCKVEYIPKLNMTRSLGDLWSVTDNDEYIISPIPDVRVHNFDLNDKFLILGTDGLWNMIRPQESIEIAHRLCNGVDVNEVEIVNAAQKLIDIALELWEEKKLLADNITAVVGNFQRLTVKSCSPLQGSTLLIEDFSDSMQASCDLEDSTKRELRKRPKELETEYIETECPLSPKKRLITASANYT